MDRDKAAYLINGRKYNFTGIRIKDGYRYGYCPKRKQYAYLFDSYVQFEYDGIIPAEKVE